MTSELLDKMPPHSLDAEGGVIGSVLLDPRCLGVVAEIVQPEDFYAEANRKIFTQLLAIDNDGKPIDGMILVERLLAAGQLDAIAGVAYLAECVHAVPHSGNITYYAGIVHDKAILRGVIQASSDTLQEAYAPTDSPQDVLDHAEQRLQSIGTVHGAELWTTTQLALEVSDFIDAVVERGQHLGLATGLPDFDERIGGLFGGEFIILAARPGIGKSALASQIADYAASSGRLVYIASLEMTGRELALRDACRTAGINSRSIRTNRITPDDRAKLVEGLARYAQWNLLLDSRSSLTVEALSRTIRRLVKDGLALAVVDYLQLLIPTDRRVPRYEQVSHQTRVLKLLARDMQVPILVLCQLNRQMETENRAPQLRDLRESGSVEQDADVVMFIHRPEGGIQLADPNDKRKKITAEWPAELIIAKQRNGETGRIKLNWTPTLTRFSCWDGPAHYDPAFKEFE